MADRNIFSKLSFYSAGILLLMTFVFGVSIFFYVERSGFYDSANYLFNYLKSGQIETPLGRYSSILPQFLLPVGNWLSFSTQQMMILFSLSYAIFWGLVLLKISISFGQPKIAFITLAGSLIGIKLSFYHTVTETYMAVFLAGLWYAILESDLSFFSKFLTTEKRKDLFRFLCLLSTLIICYFTHPVTMLLLSGVSTFHIIDRKKWKHNVLAVLALFMIALYGSKVLLIDSKSYEGSYFSKLALAPLTHFWDLESFRYLVFYSWKKHVITTFLGISLFVYYIYVKKIWKLLWLVVCVGGILLLTIIIYREGDSEIMMEKNFIPITFLIFLAWVQDFDLSNFSFIKFKFFRYGILGTIMLISMVQIIRGGKYLQKRSHAMKEMIQTARKKNSYKFIIEESKLPQEIRSQPYWAISMESLLLSSDGKAVTFYCVKKISDLDTHPTLKKDDPNLFLFVPFWIQADHSFVNPKYFNISPAPYKIW